MDKHKMTSGVIPLRHASLPGQVKLPRRYEKAAMGTNGIPARLRKISIQSDQRVLGDALSDRLDDLMAAILWVKQELIMLRQHDILLKRQFFNIQYSIQSLQKPKSSATSTTTSATTTSSKISTQSQHLNTTSATLEPSTTTTYTTTFPSPTILLNGNPLEEEEEEATATTAAIIADAVAKQCSGNVSKNHLEVMDLVIHKEFFLDTFVVRPSSSVTLLKEDSEEEVDTFCEDFFFRPRTSSMRTSRDMAALARRRGSKELI